MRILRYVWLLSCPAELTSAEAKMFAKTCAELETHVWVQCYFLLQVVHTTWQVNRPAHLTANSVAAIKHMGIHTHTDTRTQTQRKTSADSSIPFPSPQCSWTSPPGGQGAACHSTGKGAAALPPMRVFSRLPSAPTV